MYNYDVNGIDNSKEEILSNIYQDKELRINFSFNEFFETLLMIFYKYSINIK